MQNAKDEHTPSKTSRPVSSDPWFTSEIRQKIQRKTRQKRLAEVNFSQCLKCFGREQHDLGVNNLLCDLSTS